jgi:hypothetical protein
VLSNFSLSHNRVAQANSLPLVFRRWIGYKFNYLEVNGMKGKWFVIGVLVLGFFLFFNAFPSHTQKLARTLTLLYSNNINGEIEPCPT